MKKDTGKRITTVRELEAKLASMRKAEEAFASFSQEQVDRIFFEAALAANKARIPLAKMAVEETGMGIVPVDRKERDFRETCGRTLCLAAQLSDEVWRVICGIGERIK